MERIVFFLTNVELYGIVLIAVGIILRQIFKRGRIPTQGVLGGVYVLIAVLFRLAARIAVMTGIFFLLIEWFNKR